VNGAAGLGFAPDAGSGLAAWHARANRRASVAGAARAAAEVAQASSGASLAAVRTALEQGIFRREYRDHRLEWMVKVGGLDVVASGLERGNIRFTDEFGP
jgi:glutathione S-transferase/RNA polymerase-associated protein